MGLGQYNSLGEYCVPHTASSVFVISILTGSLVMSLCPDGHQKPPLASGGRSDLGNVPTRLSVSPVCACAFTMKPMNCWTPDLDVRVTLRKISFFDGKGIKCRAVLHQVHVLHEEYYIKIITTGLYILKHTNYLSMYTVPRK